MVKKITTTAMPMLPAPLIMVWMPAEKAPVMLMIWMQPLISSTEPMMLALSTKPWWREVKNCRKPTGVWST